MSENLKLYLPVLEACGRIKSTKYRTQVLRIFAKHKMFVKAIEEIALNTVNMNIKLPENIKIKLKKK